MTEYDIDQQRQVQPQPHPLSDEGLYEDPTNGLRAMRDFVVGGAQQAQLREAVQADEARFTQFRADYPDALGYMRELEAAKLRADAPDLPDDQLARVLQAQEQQFAAQSFQMGKSPSERLYAQARAFGSPSIQDSPLHISEVKTPKQADEFRDRMNTEFTSVMDEIGIK